MQKSFFLMVCGLTVFLAGCQGDKQASSSQSQPAAPAVSAAPAQPTASAHAEATVKTVAATQVVPAKATIIRIKAGAATPLTDSSGNVWLADQGFDGGDVVERPELAIANTKDQALYQSEHYSMTSFSYKIPNGKYVAKLHFAETFEGISGPGERVFSFTVMGHEFKDFDIWKKSGGAARAYIETVPVDVTNGTFKIDFVENVEHPQICAIEIIPAS
jgi:hypothetical protein